MRKQYFILLLLAVGCFSTFSQTLQTRRFGTQSYMNAIASTDTAFQKFRADIESTILDFKNYGVMDTFEIPVVFHILYNDTWPISAEDLEAQLARLNVDFFNPVNPYVASDEYRFTKADDSLTYLHPADKLEGFATHTANPLIRFCFPQFDPQGDSTSGVISVPLNTRFWGISDSIKRSDLGGSNPWDTGRYCNIWVVSLSDSLAGFAQMPGASVLTDGIVIDEKYFLRADGSVPEGVDGSDFALGRTLVHLMGSYLGLFELWDETTPCGDDFVEDTPIHNAPNFGKNEYRHVTTCEGNAVEMTMNFMDSGCDSTMYMFTWGQVARMQAVLHHYRKELKTTVTGCTTELVKLDERSVAREQFNTEPLRIRAIPNPNAGDFVVEIYTDALQESEATLQVFNAAGKILLEKRIPITPGTSNRFPVTGHDWPVGIYTIRVSTGKSAQVQQVILNH